VFVFRDGKKEMKTSYAMRAFRMEKTAPSINQPFWEEEGRKE
jgi:hypothetical protein